ncbi:MAG: hypothetical protein F8N37_25935 [Telmatospirillum sp.]|nr:hypothetical protein [Telmatospirillum sp.]
MTLSGRVSAAPVSKEGGSGRHVVFLLSLLAGLLLSGCMHLPPPPPPDIEDISLGESWTMEPGQGIAIVGLFLVNSPPNRLGLANNIALRWVRIDPSTRLRVSSDVVWAKTPGGVLYYDDLPGGGVLKAFRLPAGRYALALAIYEGNWFFPTQFQSVTVGQKIIEFSPAARALPGAPTFDVSPGEAVYAGDLILDVGAPKRLTWSLRDSQASARALLAGKGHSESLPFRPLIRADGAALTKDEGVPAR